MVTGATQGEGDSTDHAATTCHSESDQVHFEFSDRFIASGCGEDFNGMPPN